MGVVAGLEDDDVAPEDTKSPVVLILGDFMHEGLRAKIGSLGFVVVSRRLRSTVKNWRKIIALMQRLIDEDRLVAVIGYLPTPSMMVVADAEYDEVRPLLLEQIGRTRSLIFVFEDNLEGNVEPPPWELIDEDDEALAARDLPWRTLLFEGKFASKDEWLAANTEAVARVDSLLADLAHRGIEVTPFRRRSDVTLRVFDLIDQIQSGEFLKLYVPHGRYQSEQFEDFLTTLSRYLRDVEGTDIAIEVQRTQRGSTYVFKAAAPGTTIETLRDASARFDAFLTLASREPAKAEAQLVAAGRSHTEAAFITHKYGRAHRRLVLEMRHEHERKQLLLRQQFENEVEEGLVDSLVPQPPEQAVSGLFSIVGNGGPVTVNLNGPVAAAIAGGRIGAVGTTVEYSPEDSSILEQIDLLADKVEALRLRSELERLKDQSTSPESKRTAVSKLKSFLYASGRYAAKKVDEVGTAVLIKYLEGLLGPTP
jgi:hypothetical protein